MLTTNLLPAEEKKIVRFEDWHRMLIFFTIGVLLALGIGLVLLLPSFLPTYFEQRELERSLRLEEETSLRLKADETLSRIRTVRAILSSLRGFLPASSRASEILDWLLGESPAGISITNFSISQNGAISLSGYARNRHSLLGFEKKLRDAGRFQEISSPLANIIREENINFTIQGKLKQAQGL